MRDLLPTTPHDTYSYRTDTTVPPFPDDKALMVFDGYCGLCTHSVQFTLRHDQEGQFRFLPAQTALGDALYRHYGLNPGSYETFILLDKGHAYFASDAAIKIFRMLGFPWSLASALQIIPKPLRDWAYLAMAHNRMRFFGRKSTCYLPSPDTAERFLDGKYRLRLRLCEHGFDVCNITCYILNMIQSIRHKDLRRLFEDGDRSKLSADMVGRLEELLTVLNDATSLEDLALPSYRLHPLKGSLDGFYAVTVRANWRLVFRFDEGDILDLDLLDYH